VTEAKQNVSKVASDKF
jgi:ElaB/YqjD/DUF883 family membrane-anchored ribosome-binding protein